MEQLKKDEYWTLRITSIKTRIEKNEKHMLNSFLEQIHIV